MSTLVYAPDVEVHIATMRNGIVDVSADISNGNLTRVSNGVSNLNLTIINPARKYDNMFTPMDRVIVYLRRIKRLLEFAGYLDKVPLFSTHPNSISLTASCSLKRLQNWLWDPDSTAASVLLRNEFVAKGDTNPNDGGMAQRTIDLLTNVVGWPKEQIHIGRVPLDWFNQIKPLADRLVGEAEVAHYADTAGSQSWLGGANPLQTGKTSIPSSIHGTGTLPNTQGKISGFAGRGTHDATGNFALTGEPGTNPRDVFYCAMRWPYQAPDGSPYPDINVAAAKSWWANRKILAVNIRTHKAVCLRAADWGPALWTGRVLDMSPQMCDYMGGTDQVVHIAFADPSTPLGPVKGSTLGSQLAGQGFGSSQPIDQGWTTSRSDETTITVQGCTFTVNKMAVVKFTGFVNDLVNVLGYHPHVIGGYRPGSTLPGSTHLDNHAYGAAIDIDPSLNPRYGTGRGGPYKLPKPPKIIQLARKWGIGWGGEYQNLKDYMHFEVLGAPASDAAAYGQAIPGGVGPPLVSKWQPPFKDFTITLGYGAASSLYASGHHTGTDFVAAGGVGSSIHPVGPGVVHLVGYDGADYGNYASVDHGNGVYTFYAHMVDAPDVRPGDHVDVSTRLGGMGATGNVTGAHTHVELRFDEDTYDGSGRGLDRRNDIQPYLVGGPNRPNPPRGVTGTVEGGSSGSSQGEQMANAGAQLLDTLRWEQTGTMESSLLSGNKALLNDVPILTTIQECMASSLRDFCSAPNGDFIGWFPDYFGLYGTAGKVVVSDVEIVADSGLTIDWDDTNMKTHQFVTGSSFVGANDASSLLQESETAGVASVEEPLMMAALFNVDPQEFKDNGQRFLSRYGARVDWQQMNSITGARQEFFFACYYFQQNFSLQYQAQVPITFMPEVWPGMLACFPRYGIQGYVREVSHSWDLSNGGQGFTTTITCAPWSTMGKNKGPQGLPVGAPL